MKNQRGIAYPGIILVVVVLLLAGFIGWLVWRSNSEDSPAQDAIKNAECAYDDQDLCKFFVAWKAQDGYEYKATSTQNGKESKTTTKIEGSDKLYMKLEGDVDYEIIQINNILYTKASDGTWWKQALPESEANKYKEQSNVDLTEPNPNNGAQQITYRKVGKEKCGDLTCFKYQVADPGNVTTTTFIWFDDKNYQLRRMQTTSGTYTMDATYSYNNVSVAIPSPVKDLGTNQYLVPGQSEPTTLPSTGDNPTEEELQQLLQQYQ